METFKEYYTNKHILTESKTLDILKGLINKIPKLKNVIDLNNLKKTMQILFQKVGDLSEKEFELAKQNAMKIVGNPNDPGIVKELQYEAMFDMFRNIQKGIFATMLIIIIAGIANESIAGMNSRTFNKARAQQEQNVEPEPTVDNFHQQLKGDVDAKIVNIDGVDYVAAKASSPDLRIARDKANMNASGFIADEFGDGTYTGIRPESEKVSQGRDGYTAYVLMNIGIKK